MARRDDSQIITALKMRKSLDFENQICLFWNDDFTHLEYSKYLSVHSFAASNETFFAEISKKWVPISLSKRNI